MREENACMYGILDSCTTLFLCCLHVCMITNITRMTTAVLWGYLLEPAWTIYLGMSIISSRSDIERRTYNEILVQGSLESILVLIGWDLSLARSQDNRWNSRL